VAFLDRGTGIRAVDPNLRPGLPGSADPRASIAPLVERCTILLGGESELQVVAHSVEQGEALARTVARLGPREVVVKRGRAGAAVLDADGMWHEHRPPPDDETDPVGAGDAFNAGYLAARLRDEPPLEALVAGTVAGARAARTFGDVGPGMEAIPVASVTEPHDLDRPISTRGADDA
jgi:2-dehydro-3-deoxygluconokinase